MQSRREFTLDHTVVAALPCVDDRNRITDVVYVTRAGGDAGFDVFREHADGSVEWLKGFDDAAEALSHGLERQGWGQLHMTTPEEAS